MDIKCSDSKVTNIEYCKAWTDIRDYFAEYIQTCLELYVDKTGGDKTLDLDYYITDYQAERGCVRQ